VRERQAAEALHQLIGCMRRQIRRGRDARLVHRLLDRVARGINHHRADAEAKGEQVAQRDRPLRRHGVVERAVDALQDLAVGELRQPGVDRIIEAQLCLLDEHHRGRGGDRLGDRSDAENRVAPHRVLAAERLHADRLDMRLAAPADERDEAGHPAALDMAGHDLAHAGKARPRQASAAHGPLPASRRVRRWCGSRRLRSRDGGQRHGRRRRRGFQEQPAVRAHDDTARYSSRRPRVWFIPSRAP
jgi:hypothetical protein